MIISKYFLCMCFSVLCACVSQVMLKKSANKTYKSFVREYLNQWVIGGYGLLVASMLLTWYAYHGLDYKNGPIIESMGNVLVPLLSYFVFKEKLTVSKCLGILCIMLGILVFYS